MPTYVSLAEFARDRGVKRQSVHEWAKKYDIPLVEGKLDLEVARVQWDVHRKRRTTRSGADDSKGERGSSGGGADYWASKTKREEAEARLAELKLAEMAGKLVARADVERASFTAARILRDQLAAASPRLAAAVVGLPDVVAIERTIAAEHRAALETFCKMLRIQPEAV